MPLYLFHCPDCRVDVQFFSQRPRRTRPPCPHCERPRLQRALAPFAVGGNAGARREALRDTFDRLAAATSAAGTRGSLEESWRGYERSLGRAPGAAMREAVRRLDRGDDPEAVERDLAEAIESEGHRGGGSASRSPARMDPRWYEF